MFKRDFTKHRRERKIKAMLELELETKKAIAPHGTVTSAGAWDGPANKANLKNDESASYYRKAFAWQDPDGDPDVKANYKFIHHEVNAQGEIGPANLIACTTGIGVLNGGRGGTTIPEEDKRGVWRHLARHIKDAGNEPPELRESTQEIEYRSLDLVELRVSQQGKLAGYAAVFNQYSLPNGMWIEIIRPGAFSKSIKDKDIRALWNHDDSEVLGRTGNGTLKLLEDAHGLAVEIDPSKTAIAQDRVETIRRGDVNQMSIGFVTIQDLWTVKGKDGIDTRELLEIDLWEVSPVTFPAYPQTSIALRSMRYPGLAQVSPPDSKAVPAQVRRSIFLLREGLKLAEF